MLSKNIRFRQWILTFLGCVGIGIIAQSSFADYIEGKSNQYGIFRLAPPQRFIALTKPSYIPVNKSKLADDEIVIGLKVGNESRAFPVRQMWYHHVVNDEIGGEKLSLTY